MGKQWFGGLVLGWGLLVGLPAHAQYLPMGHGPAPMPEPMPFAPSHTAPSAVVGPMNPLLAPSGPPDCLGLPPDTPNAFPDCDPVGGEPRGCYIGAGAQAFQRANPANVPLVRLSSPPFPTATDPIALDPGNLNPTMAWGPRFTAGLFWGDHGLDFIGFYVPESSTSLATLALPVVPTARLAVPLVNPPVGFAPTTFLRANVAAISLDNTLASLECNFRTGVTVCPCISLFIGARYIDQQERFGLFLDASPLGLVPPVLTQQMTYTIRTHNRLVGVQGGLEVMQGVCNWLGIGMHAKGTWGMNFADVDTTLQRGDGFYGPGAQRRLSTSGQAYDMSFFVDVYFCNFARVRGAYSLLWLVGVLDSVDQINFDLLQPLANVDTSGCVFYQGPMVQLEFRF
ncbi:MAG: hypothetical protein NZ700_17730 [Gemmataceae bacterium]|nr:hypothetical protein [Gemmataceae bacterium]MDW8267427.1 hypothetical protein [Gemmataceae bacterium]